MNTPPIAKIQSWSTRDIAAGQRLAFYSDVISSALDPMVVARAVTDPFDGEITATRLGPLILVHGVSTAHDCVRGAEHVALSTSRQAASIAATTRGWLCPTVAQIWPAVKSSTRCPSTLSTNDPDARATTPSTKSPP